MVYQIVFQKRFTIQLEKTLSYLESEFGTTVAQKFAALVQRKLSTLQQQPFIGRTSSTVTGVKSISASTQNRIYYKVKGNKISILNMYDTRINPSRNKLE